jgi:hypothetical protein
VGRMSTARVDTGDREVRVGRSRQPLVRVAVVAVGLVITVLAAGCGGSDEQSRKRARRPSRPLPRMQSCPADGSPSDGS